MSDRIPHALSWLVKRRRNIAGHIKVAEKRRAQLIADRAKELQQIDIELRALQADLDALDQTIQLHEIPIDTTKLGTTRVQLNPRRTTYGSMTRAIYAALAQARPKALTTDTIAAFVCMRCDINPTQQEYQQIRNSVRRRLKDLASQGLVARLHSPYANDIGLWCDVRESGQLIEFAEQGRKENPERPLGRVPQAGFREIAARYNR